MHNLAVPLTLACLSACSSVAQKADPASDAPEEPRPVATFKDVASYAQALQRWRTPDDVNNWIGARFHYDASRTMLLSETERGKSGRPPVHQAQEFFLAPSGICVDLSRFTVETLRAIDPGLDAKYLMIEFSPVTVGGNVLRMHWLASFTRDGKHYFLGDSKRPGHIAGPYSSTQEFVAEYSRYRSRSVVSFREPESYQGTQRTMASKERRDELRP
jgi:hypothetical protein